MSPKSGKTRLLYMLHLKDQYEAARDVAFKSYSHYRKLVEHKADPHLVARAKLIAAKANASFYRLWDRLQAA